jgi:hypothetical protein
VRVPKIKFSKVTLGYMLATAWVVSIALSPFFRHPSDVPTWKFLGEITFNLRINPLPYTSFYGSCWLFTILSSFPTYLIVSLFKASDLFLNLILKVPIIIGDLIVGVVLFKFTKSKLVTALWLLNPFVIFVSAIQGQFDVLPTLFVLLATYFLLQRKNLASAVSLAIGIGFKIFPVFLLPFFIIFSLKNCGRKATLKYVIVLAAVVAVLFAPFFLPQNFKYLYEGLSDLPQRSVAYVGSSVSYIEYLTLHLHLFSNYNFLYVFIPLYLALLFVSRKFVKDFNTLNLSIIVVLLLLFVTYNTMHPQFLMWILPFLFIEYERNKKVPLVLVSALFIWMLVWIFSWNLGSWVVGPLQSFFANASSGANNQLLLVSSMNFSAYAFACLASVTGLLHRIKLASSKWVRYLVLFLSTLLMDLLLYLFYGSSMIFIPVLCFGLFFPLIILSFGEGNS